jgi:hypothetical protein
LSPTWIGQTRMPVGIRQFGESLNFFDNTEKKCVGSRRVCVSCATDGIADGFDCVADCHLNLTEYGNSNFRRGETTFTGARQLTGIVT